MGFKIEYLSNGQKLGEVVFKGTLEDATKGADDIVEHRDAEMARILDDDDKLVAVVHAKPPRIGDTSSSR